MWDGKVIMFHLNSCDEEGTFFNECQTIDFLCFVNGRVKVIGCVVY